MPKVRCGSQHHRAQECPQRKPPGEASGKLAPSNQVAASDETLDARYAELQAELAEIEHRRMMGGYTGCVGVDLVSGAVGPTYYAMMKIEGTVILSMVDPDHRLLSFPMRSFVILGSRLEFLQGIWSGRTWYHVIVISWRESESELQMEGQDSSSIHTS